MNRKQIAKEFAGGVIKRFGDKNYLIKRNTYPLKHFLSQNTNFKKKSILDFLEVLVRRVS